MNYIHNISPVAFTVFDFEVHWYGLSYVVGLLLALWYLKKMIVLYPAKNISNTTADDLFTWAILGVLLGGRLGYVLFYNPTFFFAHPSEIIAVWNGGMSFHGGLLGVLIAALIFCKRNKIHFFDIMDRVAPGACFGLLLGRIANFVNGELYGRITDMPWAVIFPMGGHVPRHPSQLYEAFLEGFLLFTILFWVAKRRMVRFELSGLFLIGYAISRYIVEFFRQPDDIPHLQEGIFTTVSMGQILSIPMFAAGIYLVYLSKKMNTRNAKSC